MDYSEAVKIEADLFSEQDSGLTAVLLSSTTHQLFLDNSVAHHK